MAPLRNMFIICIFFLYDAVAKHIELEEACKVGPAPAEVNEDGK